MVTYYARIYIVRTSWGEIVPLLVAGGITYGPANPHQVINVGGQEWAVKGYMAAHPEALGMVGEAQWPPSSPVSELPKATNPRGNPAGGSNPHGNPTQDEYRWIRTKPSVVIRGKPAGGIYGLAVEEYTVPPGRPELGKPGRYVYALLHYLANETVSYVSYETLPYESVEWLAERPAHIPPPPTTLTLFPPDSSNPQGKARMPYDEYYSRFWDALNKRGLIVQADGMIVSRTGKILHRAIAEAARAGWAAGGDPDDNAAAIAWQAGE